MYFFQFLRDFLVCLFGLFDTFLNYNSNQITTAPDSDRLSGKDSE